MPCAKLDLQAMTPSPLVYQSPPVPINAKSSKADVASRNRWRASNRAEARPASKSIRSLLNFAATGRNGASVASSSFISRAGPGSGVSIYSRASYSAGPGRFGSADAPS